MRAHLLDAQGVGFTTNGYPLVAEIALGVQAHELVALVGQNGAGR